ncbi:hypothetical protein FACS1894182_13640 [Bacteroidia bacterium]|nr:hypothetical protein FACS1894182_13640 [Bacteroidia bacterium]
MNIKNGIIAFSLAIFTLPLCAQDLVVTTNGDSLNCKITKVKGDFIYFTFKHKDEVRNTLFPKSQVVDYQYKYYSESELPASYKLPGDDYSKWRVAIDAGWSYRTAPVSDQVNSDTKKFLRNLKSGWSAGADLTYYFSEYIGLGFRYNEHLSSASASGYITYPNGSTESGMLRENIRVSYIGPLLSTRLFHADKKNCFLFNIGIGYVGYHDKQSVNSYHLTSTGGTIGTYYGIGYDIGITKNWAIGIQLSGTSGVLSSMKRSNGTSTETIQLERGSYEGLSRLDIAVGLRFNH